MNVPSANEGAGGCRTDEIAQKRVKLAVYIFSYNRAQLLDHSLETTACCMPGFDTFVVDDDSDDPATQKVIRKWADITPVLEAGQVVGEKKTGGLYPNMTRALYHAHDKGYTYALFTQDDMQFVRPFDPRDAALIEDYFAAHLKVVQLLLHFIKRPEPGVDLAERWHPDESGTSYLRTEMSSNEKACFSAGGIFHVLRTIEALGSFEMSEAKNSARMLAKGYYYGVSHAPLICFMPAPISFRGKRRSIQHRLYEMLGGAGFHPVEQMNDAEVERFWNRDRSMFPVAEDFLHCPTAPAPQNWAAGGGDYLVVARGGWRKALYDTITFTKTIMKRALGQ
jgi:glycosyltransferase involved in cell wall biosynthesis